MTSLGSTVPSLSSIPTADQLHECVRRLQERHCKLVVFDMDQTAVAMHSRGRLRRDKLDDFLSKATPGFVHLVPELFRHGFSLAIATHSDEAEFGGSVQPETHILGSELARALVKKSFSSEICDAFYIVAYNPRVHPEGKDEHNKVKRHHMRVLQQHFDLEPKEIVFFDDTEPVVRDCRETCGVVSIQVDPKKGFEVSDLLNNLQ